jgi:hypothetical protein
MDVIFVNRIIDKDLREASLYRVQRILKINNTKTIEDCTKQNNRHQKFEVEKLNESVNKVNTDTVKKANLTNANIELPDDLVENRLKMSEIINATRKRISGLNTRQIALKAYTKCSK